MKYTDRNNSERDDNLDKRQLSKKEIKMKKQNSIESKLEETGVEDIDKLYEDYKNRISIIPKTNEQQQPTSFKDRLYTKKKSDVDEELDEFLDKSGLREDVEIAKSDRDIRIVRKEVFSSVPLARLSIFNKLKVAFIEYNRFSGAADRKEAERIRAAENKRIKMEASILSGIKKAVNPLIDKNAKVVYIAIDLQRDKVGLLNNVLRDSYFTLFENIEEIPANPNYFAYGINIPILLKMTVAERGGI